MKSGFHLSHAETLHIENALNKSDGVIAFPTDTVYGMGCLVENEEAVKKIYQIKGRDNKKPLILLSTDFEYLKKYLRYTPELALELIKKYMPGGLTVVLPKSSLVPDYVTSGMGTVGIRIPNNPIFMEMIKRCVPDRVLATTSANLSNQTELLTSREVKKLLANDVDYILEEHGIILSGVASTVVTITKDNKIKILRQGAIELTEYLK